MLHQSHSDFFTDFPEYRGKIVFAGDPESIYDAAEFTPSLSGDFLIITVNAIASSFRDKKNCCKPVTIDGHKFFVVNVVEGYNFLEAVKCPVLESDWDHKEFEKFIEDHESAHAILSIIKPYKFSTGNIFLKSSEDVKRECFAEDFSDCCAALRFLQRHGEEGLKTIQRLADIRALSAFKNDGFEHYTTAVLDAVYKRFLSAESRDRLLKMSPAEVVEESLSLSEEYGLSPAVREASLEEWKNAISSPFIATISFSSVSRLFLAANRQLEVTDNEIDDYAGRYGFEAKDLSDLFKKQGFLKALIALKASIVVAEEMVEVQNYIEKNLLGSQGHDTSNKFPDLNDFVRAVKGGFMGDRYAMQSALSSPNFVNDLAHKYLGRLALKRIATYECG